MEHGTLGNGEAPFGGRHDFDVLASFIGANACLQVLEHLIREGATPTNIARQTGLMRLAVGHAADELARRGVPVPTISIVAVSRGI